MDIQASHSALKELEKKVNEQVGATVMRLLRDNPDTIEVVVFRVHDSIEIYTREKGERNV